MRYMQPISNIMDQLVIEVASSWGSAIIVSGFFSASSMVIPE